ncbi:MAG: hypothetical protein ACREMI_00410 [Gemmatimonadales bacterium]
MKLRFAALVLPVALGVACVQEPASPDASPSPAPMMQQNRPGSGLILESVTGLSLPLIGQLGDVVIDQAELTNFAIVENAVGQIVGIQVEGVLQLTGGVLGTDVVTENFLTTVQVTSSGFGRCEIVTLDLGPIDINALVAQVDVPAATVTGRGSGAVGSLLCALGQLLNPVTSGVRGVVQALNNLI